MIYLDYNATTPVDEEVLMSMLPYFTEHFGNASSKTHSLGWAADEAVKIARQQVAGIINAEDVEVIFTSGATESCNLAIKGVFEKYHSKGNHIITCKTEHHAVLDVVQNIEKKGAKIDYVPVDEQGIIDMEELENMITDQTILISIMYANNETGVIQPIAEIGALAKKYGVLFFSDATQAVGKIKVDVIKDHVDLMAWSSHKLYGPKGVGALYIRRKNPRVVLTEQINGGGHEKGLRSGTLNVPGIVGFGKACMIAEDIIEKEMQRLKRLRDFLENSLSDLPGFFVNGDQVNRLPSVSNMGFERINAERLLNALHFQIAFSLGSACTSGNRNNSHVLKAMNVKEGKLNASFRMSLGKYTKEEDIKITIKLLKDGLENMSNQ